MAVSPELAREIVQEAGLDHGGKASALPGSKGRVSNDTPTFAPKRAVSLFCRTETRPTTRGNPAPQVCPQDHRREHAQGYEADQIPQGKIDGVLMLRPVSKSKHRATVTRLEATIDGVPATDSSSSQGHALCRGVAPKLPEPPACAKQNCANWAAQSQKACGWLLSSLRSKYCGFHRRSSALQLSGRQGTGSSQTCARTLPCCTNWRQQGRIHVVKCSTDAKFAYNPTKLTKLFPSLELRSSVVIPVRH